jgi:hypothetical protein
MKQVFVLFTLIFLTGIFMANSQCCSRADKAGNKTQALAMVEDNSESKVEAYYFHFSRRCVTCREVERISSEALEDLYGEKIKLKSVSLDDKSSEELVKKLGVEGQSLLIVNGTKKVDITFDGFMYAQSDPEKFKQKIKTAVESLK